MTHKSWCYYKINVDCTIMIDEEDLDKVQDHKWHITKGENGKEKIFTRFFKNGKYSHLTLGRHITDCPANKVVCMWQDRRDFRKSNLLVCSISEKQHHYKRMQPKTTSHTSKYPGVSWDRQALKWRASIAYNGKSFYLGLFEKESDAAHAYEVQSEKYFSIEGKKAS